MNTAVLASLLATMISAATPLLLAALGELVVERAGVLNLGLEGMMLCGAVGAFAVMSATGNHTLAVCAGGMAGCAIAAFFGLLTLGLSSNQVATGLAMTIFGTGLSSVLGAGFTGHPVAPLPPLPIPLLSKIPFLGNLLFNQNGLVYLSVVATFAVAAFLARTRAGLILRVVGESDISAHAIGFRVLRVRFAAVLFGGVMSGLAGADLSLAYTPLWVEGMTAGRGWIALAIVVFAAWRPLQAMLGAYIFGGIAVLQLYLQGSGLLPVPAQVFSMAPYLGTVLVLVVISSGRLRSRLGAPAGLGKPFKPAR